MLNQDCRTRRKIAALQKKEMLDGSLMGCPEHTYATVKNVPAFPSTQLPFLLLCYRFGWNRRKQRIIFLMNIIKLGAFCINNSICARSQPGDWEEEGVCGKRRGIKTETCRLQCRRRDSVDTIPLASSHQGNVVKSAHYADYKIDYKSTI